VRTSEIVQQMRALVRKEKTTEPVLYDARSILGDALALLDHDLHANGVSVRNDFHDGPERVLVNRVQIEQVAVNLIQNGVHAMLGTDGERQLTVRTRIDAGPPDFVEVSISDNGAGLPEKADRIFEPFFTTKEHGMGQGLAISRTIIESHGGTLRAQRNDGPGATLVFTLPVAREHEN
jgi:signal transduction histidine kinase